MVMISSESKILHDEFEQEKNAKAHSKYRILILGFDWALKFVNHATGLVNKIFGNLAYDQEMSKYKVDYQKFSLEEAIQKTEK